jgi:glycosyltransferase involved in cell wall biosynthesis
MKVLMVGMEWLPNRAGGLNRYFYDAVHSLPTVGIAGTALVSYLEQGQRAPLKLQAMAHRGASLPQVWRGARQAVRAALQEGVEIVNPHFALYTWPWLRDLPSGMPVVINFQGPWADEIAVEASKRYRNLRVLLARRMEQRVYRRADRIITLSDSFREIIVGRYGVDASRVRVVPGGMEATRFLAAPERQEARESLGWPQDRRILFTVRRLTRRMGLENLIDAFVQIHRQHPDTLLLIGGQGHLEQALKARIAAAGLNDCVRMLGFVPDADLPLAYAAADVTIVPTLALEGFGLVTLESLAAGTPVLGTPVGGTPEILRGLSRCLIFESTEPQAIADRIASALAGRLALPDRATCRAYASRYAWTEIAPRIHNVFAEARESMNVVR